MVPVFFGPSCLRLLLSSLTELSGDEGDDERCISDNTHICKN
jgi:hypothetical protein